MKGERGKTARSRIDSGTKRLSLHLASFRQEKARWVIGRTTIKQSTIPFGTGQEKFSIRVKSAYYRFRVSSKRVPLSNVYSISSRLFNDCLAHVWYDCVISSLVSIIDNIRLNRSAEY